MGTGHDLRASVLLDGLPPVGLYNNKTKNEETLSASLSFLRPEGLTDRLVAWLRQEIVQGRLAAGARLIESELAARAGVSRVPLREAFRILAAEGLIETFLHRGAMVRPLCATEMRELFGVRAAIETHAAAEAARRPGAGQALGGLVANMRRVVAAGEMDAYARLAARFHEELVEAGGNRLLADMYAQILTRLGRYQAAMAQVPHLPETSIAEHAAIAAAIAAGDGSHAGALARAHLDGLVAQLRLPEDAPQPAATITKSRTRTRA